MDRSFLAGIFAIGVAAAGCGGNVVVDGPGGAGGGDGGGTPTGATTTSTVFSPGSYCSFVCGQADLHGCLEGAPVSECQQGCVLVFDAYDECQGELKAFYDCVVAQLPKSCGNDPDACFGQIEDLTACASP